MIWRRKNWNMYHPAIFILFSPVLEMHTLLIYIYFSRLLLVMLCCFFLLTTTTWHWRKNQKETLSQPTYVPTKLFNDINFFHVSTSTQHFPLVPSNLLVENEHMSCCISNKTIIAYPILVFSRFFFLGECSWWMWMEMENGSLAEKDGRIFSIFILIRIITLLPYYVCILM